MNQNTGNAAERRSRAGTVAACLMIVAAGLAAYSNSLHGPFIFDDEAAILKNEHVRHLWPLSTTLSAPPETAASGRPIVSLSLAINYCFGQYNVWGYHAFNLAVHLLTALLLLAVLRRTLESPLMPEAVRRSAGGLAAASALLWTVHPLSTEAIVYVVQRTRWRTWRDIRNWAAGRTRISSSGSGRPRGAPSNGTSGSERGRPIGRPRSFQG